MFYIFCFYNANTDTNVSIHKRSRIFEFFVNYKIFIILLNYYIKIRLSFYCGSLVLCRRYGKQLSVYHRFFKALTQENSYRLKSVTNYS